MLHFRAVRVEATEAEEEVDSAPLTTKLRDLKVCSYLFFLPCMKPLFMFLADSLREQLRAKLPTGGRNYSICLEVSLSYVRRA